MKKYSILVVEHEGERELCQCDNNPEAIAQAALNKKVSVASRPAGGLIRRVPKYSSVRIVENKQ